MRYWTTFVVDHRTDLLHFLLFVLTTYFGCFFPYWNSINHSLHFNFTQLTTCSKCSKYQYDFHTVQSTQSVSTFHLHAADLYTNSIIELCISKSHGWASPAYHTYLNCCFPEFLSSFRSKFFPLSVHISTEKPYLVRWAQRKFVRSRPSLTCKTNTRSASRPSCSDMII